MTALVSRPPLHPLSMSAVQRPPRRLSARLQEKEEIPGDSSHSQQQPAAKAATSSRDAFKADNARGANIRKRKNGYDEEEDGFTFSRVKKKQQKHSATESVSIKGPQPVAALAPDAASAKLPVADGEAREPPKKRRNKMSFSTPNPKEIAPVRRSKRLSDEHDARMGSPPPKARIKDPPLAASEAQADLRSEPQPEKSAQPPPPEEIVDQQEKDVESDHSATKIALPFADTPVIRRNKAMRENKSSKGERRSSLGMRGRRASSLIESGSSNALPHSEVEICDFYKHIESDGLSEPRRMRQLLTWCCTRSLDQKSMGAEFEDASAVSAAKVIEDELLRELSNHSELSDWFAREDVPEQPKSLPERPNPKNEQNAEKIVELEEQIRLLRAENDALESLLRPPSLPSAEEMNLSNIDSSLLNENDATILHSLRSGTDMSINISNRLNSLQECLGPAVDAFADGVHKIGQYRNAAESVAGRVLSICSEKLAQRDQAERKRALEKGEDTSPRRDLNSVLRGLSRVDR